MSILLLKKGVCEKQTNGSENKDREIAIDQSIRKIP